MTQATSIHLAPNRAISAHIRRQEIAKAAATWAATCPTNEETDIAFDAALVALKVIGVDDVVFWVTQDDPESPVCILINGSEIIEIDSEGNTLRGSV